MTPVIAKVATLPIPVLSVTELIEKLKWEIDGVLEPLLSTKESYALLDFPDHDNCGDSLIWCGERAYFKKKGLSAVYTSGHEVLFTDELRRNSAKDAVILLTGGGSFGDLWPSFQGFREEIITRFPDRKIIQLPQTIYFKNMENLKKCKEIINSHPNFTLLVRDQQSLNLARNEFKVKSLLCPDMAFELGPITRPIMPTKKIVWLARIDIESAGKIPPVDEDVIDWKMNEPKVLRKFDWFIRDQITNRPRALRNFWPLLSWTDDLLAREQSKRACQLLSRAQVIVTDRLHGHILSLLMGIPHVCYDNAYGKIRRFYETWTQDSPITRWADSPIEALHIAKALVFEKGVSS